MEMKVGKKYRLDIDLAKRVMTFSAEIISVGERFVKFKDKFGKIKIFNINSIVQIEEEWADD